MVDDQLKRELMEFMDMVKEILDSPHPPHPRVLEILENFDQDLERYLRCKGDKDKYFEDKAAAERGRREVLDGEGSSVALENANGILAAGAEQKFSDQSAAFESRKGVREGGGHDPSPILSNVNEAKISDKKASGSSSENAERCPTSQSANDQKATSRIESRISSSSPQPSGQLSHKDDEEKTTNSQKSRVSEFNGFLKSDNVEDGSGNIGSSSSTLRLSSGSHKRGPMTTKKRAGIDKSTTRQEGSTSKDLELSQESVLPSLKPYEELLIDYCCQAFVRKQQLAKDALQRRALEEPAVSAVSIELPSEPEHAAANSKTE